MLGISRTCGWAILIILIIILLYFGIRASMTSEDFLGKYETPAELKYNNVFGYENTPESREALQTALVREERPNPPAQNAFIIGDLMEFNYDNHAVALMYYQDAIERLVREPEDPHADHIIDRIEDIAREIDVAPARSTVRQSRVKLKNVAVDAPIVEIKSDPQNVHDSHVNSDLRKVYNEIVQHNMLDDTPPATRQELIDYLKEKLPAHKLTRARKTLKSMSGMNTAIGDHENMVIDNVWQRINSKENLSRASALKESFADALVDCTNKLHYTVCSGGRCARILSSLTLLDADDAVAAPVKTREILRSEIMSKAHKVLQDALATSPAAADYLAGKDTPEVNQFEEQVKQNITQTIIRDYPNESTKNLGELISDAHAGV
jgi:hypothetical protein